MAGTVRGIEVDQEEEEWEEGHEQEVDHAGAPTWRALARGVVSQVSPVSHGGTLTRARCFIMPE